MPTLNRRLDGLFFVRHFYGEHHTWQVTSEGVRYLEFRGVGEGVHFTTTLFMEMVVQGLVYTGQRPKPGFSGGIRSAHLPDAMFPIVSSFHQALRQGDVREVTARLWLPPAGQEGRAPVIKLVGDELSDRARLPSSWKLKDSLTYDLPASEQSSHGGADLLTIVRVRLTIQESAVEVTEYWLRADSGWHVCWGFLPNK
jgi:hypothetical protein